MPAILVLKKLGQGDYSSKSLCNETLSQIFLKKLIHNSLVIEFNPLKHKISVWRYICKYTIPVASNSRSPICFLSVTDGVYKELAKSKLLDDPWGLSMRRQRKQGRDHLILNWFYSLRTRRHSYCQLQDRDHDHSAVFSTQPSSAPHGDGLLSGFSWSGTIWR